MELSLVIPVYNCAGSVRADMSRLLEFLSGHFESFELIIVNDGSSDDTAAQILLLNHPAVRLESLPHNQGKFAAICRGMEIASGQSCVFTDADLPFDLEALGYISQLILKRGYHVVTGDRSLKESYYGAALPLSRRLASRFYSHIVRLALTGGLFDTQCGLKGFSRDAAKELFPLIRDKRFGGDIELLYLALKYNLEIRRIPVRLKRCDTSTVKLSRDTLGLLLRLAMTPLLWRLKVYESESLRRLGAQAYWDSAGER